MAGPIDEIDKRPVDKAGNVNQPASGTYGEKADLDRLRSSLPEMNPAALGSGGQTPSQPPVATPTPTPAGASTATPPPGVPAVLMAPTSRLGQSSPTTPSPLPVRPTAPAVSGVDRTLQVLTLLVSEPGTSSDTREWAEGLISALTEG